LKKSHGLK